MVELKNYLWNEIELAAGLGFKVPFLIPEPSGFPSFLADGAGLFVPAFWHSLQRLALLSSANCPDTDPLCTTPLGHRNNHLPRADCELRNQPRCETLGVVAGSWQPDMVSSSWFLSAIFKHSLGMPGGYSKPF